MKFQELKLDNQGNWFKRKLSSSHIRKTLRYIVFGAIGGFLFYYFTEGFNNISLSGEEILKNVAFGALFGFLITNSPCARGKC